MAQSNARAQGVPDGVADRLTDQTAPMTYDEHVALLASGMETAMHIVLCLRQVYPVGAYTRKTIRAKGGNDDPGTTSTYTAYTARHPGLAMYFTRVRDALQNQLTHQDVAAVAILLQLPQSGKVLERYVFRLSYAWPQAPPAHERSIPVASAWSAADFNQKFGTMMAKLTALLATLSPLPFVGQPRPDGGEDDIDDDEVSPAVVLQLKDPSSRPSAHAAGARPDPHQAPEGQWVPLDPKLTRELPVGRAPDSERESHGTNRPMTARGKPAQIVPVQSLTSGVIDMAFYVEDHTATKATVRRHAARKQRP